MQEENQSERSEFAVFVIIKIIQNDMPINFRKLLQYVI
jgi:hypothetical protein